MKTYTDKELIEHWLANRKIGIELIFRTYYGFVCKALLRIIPDENVAEDLAQEVFFELWRKKDDIVIRTSLKAYLRRAARNRALNHIRDQKIIFDGEDQLPKLKYGAPSINQQLAAQELQKILDAAIDSLPERCRIIFALSRYEDMSYKEIAKELGISVKTVEHQIGKALKVLRAVLGPYLIKCLLFFIFFNS